VPLRAQCPVLETFSVSHGKAYAYLPLIDLLRTYFHIALEDDERARREKVTGKVLALDRALEDTLPYVFALLGITDPMSALPQMDSQVRRRSTLEAVKRILLRETLDPPDLICEDLHWFDGESQAFLDLLVRRGDGPAPVARQLPPGTTTAGAARRITRSCDSIRSGKRRPASCWRRCWARGRRPGSIGSRA
jgi:hypothetical protein